MSQLEQAIAQANESRNFQAMWEAFVNSVFYVQVFSVDEKSPDPKFCAVQSPFTQNQLSIVVSEDLERLGTIPSTHQAVRMQGADLVRILNPALGIIVGYSGGGFAITKEQVQQLRGGLPSNQPTL